jgi:hypothetical protein
MSKAALTSVLQELRQHKTALNKQIINVLLVLNCGEYYYNKQMEISFRFYERQIKKFSKTLQTSFTLNSGMKFNYEMVQVISNGK